MAIMMIFDFLKRLLGWADEGSRKRRANDSSLTEDSCVSPKRRCCDHAMDRYQKSLTEFLSDSDDDDDVEILSELACSPIVPSKSASSNGYGDKRKRFSLPKPSKNYLTSVNKYSTTRRGSYAEPSRNHAMTNKSNASSSCTDHWHSTLAKTLRLHEKRQYSEMLQNFAPQRIHALDNKSTEQHRSKRPVEVIDLERSTQPPLFRREQNIPKMSSLLSLSPLCARSNAKRDVSFASRSKSEELVERIFSSSVRKAKTEKVETTSTPKPVNGASEIVATNSLRDKLAARAVIRNDFVPEVSRKYNARIEQRYKEVEELKRMTGVLSKHNRLAREAALEEQLARSMRLCEAILDDREEPEEPALPEFSPEMLREVEKALVPRPPNEVLVEGFGLRITRKDLHTLWGLNWLNDEVINFYMNLLILRGNDEKFPKVHAMNTFFYPKLISAGHDSLKRWTRKIDVFAQDLVVVPIHLGIHWCMSVIDFRNKSIRYFDSMGSSNPKCLVALRQYLEDESLDKKKKPFDTSDWKLESAKDIPQQMNGSDCGVFSCMFAEYICANRKLTFTQEDMPYFRNKMAYEILKSKLL